MRPRKGKPAKHSGKKTNFSSSKGWKKDASNERDKKSFNKPKQRFSKDDDNRSEKRTFNKPKPRFSKDDDNRGEKRTFNKPNPRFSKDDDNRNEKRTFKKSNPRFSKDDDIRGEKRTFNKSQRSFSKDGVKRTFGSFTKKNQATSGKKAQDGIRLNKYIANAGICSRREADELIQAGVIKVNGKIVTELGTKIKPGDKVNYGGQTLQNEKPVYLILNKPKDYLCTVDDPFSRKTVLQLIQNACKERVYPVGRLDRNTTGVLILTNDGELTKKLTHPKHGVKKIYHVELDKNVKAADLDKLMQGVQLEDGPAKADVVSYVKESKKDIGIEIHMGRNRIIRRMFEALGYSVVKLDRVFFAGLTKKDLPRGKWRMLTQAEINFLKMSAK